MPAQTYPATSYHSPESHSNVAGRGAGLSFHQPLPPQLGLQLPPVFGSLTPGACHLSPLQAKPVLHAKPNLQSVPSRVGHPEISPLKTSDISQSRAEKFGVSRRHGILFGGPRLIPGGLSALKMILLATGSLVSHTHRTTLVTCTEYSTLGPHQCKWKIQNLRVNSPEIWEVTGPDKLGSARHEFQSHGLSARALDLDSTVFSKVSPEPPPKSKVKMLTPWYLLGV